MRALAIVLIAGWLGGGVTQQAGVEIDRTLQRVHGTAIMASDLRQVRLLRLVPEFDQDDLAVQTVLENRLLMLREVSRAAQVEPSAEAIAARRQAWRSAWPAGTDIPALMTRTGMNDRGLDAWFRDELRIESYVDQRFGKATDTTLTTRVADWIRSLRRQAGLTVK